MDLIDYSEAARAIVREFGLDPDSEAGAFPTEQIAAQLQIADLDLGIVGPEIVGDLARHNRDLLAEIDDLSAVSTHPFLQQFRAIVDENINRLEREQHA